LIFFHLYELVFHLKYGFEHIGLQLLEEGKILDYGLNPKIDGACFQAIMPPLVHCTVKRQQLGLFVDVEAATVHFKR
jgi:hypothetical protein